MTAIDDAYSDIDVEWSVGAEAQAALADLSAILARVAPIASLRVDPDTAASASERLILLRFDGWPLFSRVDLVTLGHFSEAAAEVWSPPESALMNVVGALKAELRGRPEVNGLLSRGFTRIGATDPAGPPRERMEALIAAARAADASVATLADSVTAAVCELL